MRFWIIICVLGLMLSCGRELPPANSIKLIGHGGEGFSNVSALYAPNSVGSMQRALDFYQLDGIEVDVRFTEDSNLVIFHDAHLEASTQCKGRISDVQSTSIVGCKYRKQFRNDYSQEIISLDSFIILLNTVWTTEPISIQVQTAVEDFQGLYDLAKVYSKRISGIKDKSRIATECNNGNFLYYLRSFGDYECHLIASIDQPSFNNVFGFGVQGIVTKFNERNYELEKQLKDSGIYITVYGQKITKDFGQYRYDYIDAVQVDNPVQAIKFYKNE